MKRAIVICIVTVSLVSCIPNEGIVSRLSGIKYGDSTDSFNISGFYTYISTPRSDSLLLPFGIKPNSSFDKETGVDFIHHNIIFYPDQTVCYFTISEDSLKRHDVHDALEKCINKYGKKYPSSLQVMNFILTDHSSLHITN